MRHKALTAGFGQKKVRQKTRHFACREKWILLRNCFETGGTMRDNAMSHRVIMCNGAVFWIAHAKMNRYKRDSGALACEGFLF